MTHGTNQQDQFKQAMKEHILANGADACGVANIERFDNAPQEYHPRNLNERTQSVVVITMRVLRGILRGLDQGTSRICYNSYGYGGMNERWLKNILRNLAVWLEDRGYEATPVIQYTGKPPMEPMIDHRIAAVAAGLGEFGYSKVFLSKRFGPLQRIGVLLTDAEMEPDPMVVGEICDRCMLCVKDCPGKAISSKETTTVEIDGHQIEYGKLDVFKCALAHHGNIRETASYVPDNWDVSDIMREAEEKLKQAKTDMDITVVEEWVFSEYSKRYHHPYDNLIWTLGQSCAYCGAKGCYRACLAHLEKSGRIDSPFHQPFRFSGQTPKDIPPKRTIEGGWRE